MLFGVPQEDKPIQQVIVDLSETGFGIDNTFEVRAHTRVIERVGTGCLSLQTQR